MSFFYVSPMIHLIKLFVEWSSCTWPNHQLLEWDCQISTATSMSTKSTVRLSISALWRSTWATPLWLHGNSLFQTLLWEVWSLQLKRAAKSIILLLEKWYLRWDPTKTDSFATFLGSLCNLLAHVYFYY